MIGIFGGTFDPIHFGHLRAALELREELGLEELRLVPCRIPPHRGQPHGTPVQRLAMVRKAAEGQPGLRVDDRELRREGPSYTVDTLTSLRAELGADVTLCLMVGMDAFLELNTWYRWQVLIELAHIVVVQRPGSEVAAQGEMGTFLAARRVTAPDALRERAAGGILLWQVTQMDISSTRIRELVARGRSPRYLVPDGVWEMIRAEGLYQQQDRRD